MNRFRVVSLPVVALLCCSMPAAACLWDYDTLAMESQRFPDALELVTGRFLRHSEAYYEWRVADRTKRLVANPVDPALIDDLAVAYDKLGRQEEAIQLMRERLEADPQRYETHANLGTFLIHSGDLAAGLTHIETAIEINPDAHFGREVYQAHLVRYVLKRRSEKMEGEPPLPLRPNPKKDMAFQPTGFAAYLTELATADDPKGKVDRQAAIKGVLGMMRFGHYDSPILLEALGDLLSMPASDDAKRMATRAYLKASYETEGEASKFYRKFAKDSLEMQVRGRGSQQQVKLQEVVKLLKGELDAGRKFFAQIEADEKAWIRDGKDVDALFRAKYYMAKKTLPRPLTRGQFRWRLALVAVGISATALVLAGAAVVFFRLSRGDEKRAPQK